jgi:hypothetical protein
MDSRNFFAGCAAYHFMSESKRLCLRTKFLRLKMVHGRAAQPKKRVSSRFEYAGQAQCRECQFAATSEGQA